MVKKQEDKPKEEQNLKGCACGPDCHCEKDPTEKLQKEKEEYLEGWKRERANFLNYKKEEMERMGELMKYANIELILKILPLLDNYLIAEKNIPEDMKKDKNIIGLLQIHQQFRDFLKSQGVEEIKTMGDPSTGSGQVKFDPNFHEVVGEVEMEGKKSGIIIEETQKGYALFGKVIRPAKVKVVK